VNDVTTHLPAIPDQLRTLAAQTHAAAHAFADTLLEVERVRSRYPSLSGSHFPAAAHARCREAAARAERILDRLAQLLGGPLPPAGTGAVQVGGGST
jgi:hypothetical protein